MSHEDLTQPEASAYPLSATRGVPLPFDIGRPEALFITAVGVAASAEKEVPHVDWELVVLYATVDTIIMFGDAVTLTTTVDEIKENAQFIPSLSPVSIMLPDGKFKTISADGVSTGLLYIQKYHIWKATGQQVQQSNM